MIEAFGLNYNRGAVVKYMARAGRKPGNDALLDLLKAREHVNREIARLGGAADAPMLTHIPQKHRNCGESAGLEFPYICRALWLVWHRKTGAIAHVEEGMGPVHDATRCRAKCRELNGLGELSAAEQAEINAMHDMEP